MAAITFTATTAGSTILPLVSAFGPSVTGNYSTLALATTQSPVTAFITSFTFQNAIAYEPEGVIWLLNTAPLTGGAVRLTNTGFSLALSATVGEAALGVYTSTLTLTLCAQCLSGAGNGVNTVVDTPSAAFTFSLTAVNLPFNGYVSRDRFRRLYALGYI